MEVDLFEAIARRHSYRGAFKGQPVPRDDLRAIVQAGIQAPSGYNGQSTSFVIVDSGPLIARVAAIMESATVAGAPALVAVVMDPRATADKKFCFGVEDYAAATENMLLAVTALGYASVWVDGALRSEGRAAAVGELLGVPPGLEVRVILPVGVPAEARAQKEKKPFAERASFNRWER
jgi:nitroreductase